MNEPRTDAEFNEARRRALAEAAALFDRLLPTLDAGGQRAVRDWLTTNRDFVS
jgi:hypothetical protein